MISFTFLHKVCDYLQPCDAGNEPCSSGGVSPSMRTALSCFTGVFLTGHPCPLVCNYGVKSATLMCTLGGGVLRVEHPSPVYRTKDTRITPSLLATSSNHQFGGTHV